MRVDRYLAMGRALMDKMVISIIRDRKTDDGLFGHLTLSESLFKCFSVENLKLAIPVGTFPVKYQYSPHFNRQMPHIIVPDRSFIMFHWANYPKQLEGCIAVGDYEEPNALDDSIITFNRLNSILLPYMDISLTIPEEFL